MDVGSFSPGQDALSKSPAPAHGVAGKEPGKRQAGWPFSLVTFSLATQRECDSAAEGRRRLLLCKPKHPTKQRHRAQARSYKACAVLRDE
jgi:hypothetical protein